MGKMAAALYSPLLSIANPELVPPFKTSVH